MKRNIYMDSLWAGSSEDRISMGSKISAHVQTGPAPPPPSPIPEGTASFKGVKGSGRGAGHPTLFNAGVEKSVELNIFSPSVPSWSVLG